MGIGTSILLKMNADRALERLGLVGDVEAVDLGAAKGAAAAADLILTSAEAAEALAGVPAQVRVVRDFMDIDEICRVITQTPDLRTAGG